MNQEIIHVPEIFGSDVLTRPPWKRRLEPQVFLCLEILHCRGKPLEAPVANAIAEAMKQWAIEKKSPTHSPTGFSP